MKSNLIMISGECLCSWNYFSFPFRFLCYVRITSVLNSFNFRYSATTLLLCRSAGLFSLIQSVCCSNGLDTVLCHNESSQIATQEVKSTPLRTVLVVTIYLDMLNTVNVIVWSREVLVYCNTYRITSLRTSEREQCPRCSKRRTLKKSVILYEMSAFLLNRQFSLWSQHNVAAIMRESVQ